MIRFELVGGLIILPIVFEYSTKVKVKADALVDTGSAGTALDINLLKLDPSRASRIVELAGVGGSQDVVIQRVDGINFVNKLISDFEVEFGDVSTKFGFNAIIGSDLLDALGVCIDYESRALSSKLNL